MHRIDRHLAALKIAGWFERLAGVLVGDFHMEGEDQVAATVELLKFHLPPGSNVPVVTTHSIGHVWPMAALPINQPLAMQVTGRTVRINRI